MGGRVENIMYIFDYVVARQTPLSMKEIMDELDVSRKTAYNYIREINCYYTNRFEHHLQIRYDYTLRKYTVSNS